MIKKLATIKTNVVVVACPHCSCETKMYFGIDEHTCSSCKEKYSFITPKESHNKAEPYSNTEEVISGMSDIQLHSQSQLLKMAGTVMGGVETVTHSPEFISDVFGYTYSHFAEELLSTSNFFDEKLKGRSEQ